MRSPAKHRVDVLAQPRLPRKLHQQGNRLLGDPVFGVVEIDADVLDHEPLAAPRIGCEQLSQMTAGELSVVALELAESRSLAQRRRYMIRHRGTA